MEELFLAKRPQQQRPRRNGCFCRLVRKVDLNLPVLQRGNLLMLHAELPLVLTVPSWMLDFFGKSCESEESENF